MWGFGGKFYWGRKEVVGKVDGIVVVFAWMSSEERHVKNYVDLYSSLGWNSLVCHSQFLNLFFPDKAASLASEVISQLLKELKIKPCPVVFASFSGGPKAVLYKLLQIIEGQCQGQDVDDHRLLGDCVSGYIFDSTPVDFTSDLGTRFILHPTVLKMSRPPTIVSWIANCISSSLDAMFLSRFESDRAEYWQTLYSTVSMGAPYLILCSTNDDLAPYHVILNFTQRLQELGGDVKLVTWDNSPHVGHYRHHPSEYKGAVSELLVKAALSYSHRIRRLEGEKLGLDGLNDSNSHPFTNMRKATSRSQQSSHRVSPEVKDYSFAHGSLEYHEDTDLETLQDEHKERYVSVSEQSSISVHGVLGQFVFGECVPKDVEDWDARLLLSSRRASGKHSAFNPMKCIRRSRI